MVVGPLTGEALSEPEADRVLQARADASGETSSPARSSASSLSRALARRYEMSLTAVQEHVAVLERAALVSKQRSGREQRVAADAETLRKAATLLAAFEQLWIKRAMKIAEFEAAPERLWDVWDDPRQLERWWGPSPYPALKSPLAPCRSCALAMRMSPQAETSAQTPSSTKNPY